LGMTWGTDDMGRGLFPYVTAALSVDVPSVDARPYHPTFKKSFKRKRICSRKDIKDKNNK
ncbi:hypothetical protein K443DRAFT_95120, partial [Laccaria amethystina LaAM-08-1]